RQIGGRYSDGTDPDFMMRMGVWTENLSLPVVLNECLMQSYSGVICLFPNTDKLGEASFRDLRAAGAFLVSAAWDGKTISGEKGAPARIANPWPGQTASVRTVPAGAPVESRLAAGILEFATEPGRTYEIRCSS